MSPAFGEVAVFVFVVLLPSPTFKISLASDGS